MNVIIIIIIEYTESIILKYEAFTWVILNSSYPYNIHTYNIVSLPYVNRGQRRFINMHNTKQQEVKCFRLLLGVFQIVNSLFSLYIIQSTFEILLNYVFSVYLQYAVYMYRENVFYYHHY